jgi:hypothetical protein
MRISLGPAVVVRSDCMEHARTRLRLAELLIAPRSSKRACKARVIGMSDEPPAGLGFHA